MSKIKKQVEKVTREAIAEAEQSQEYQMYAQTKLEVQNNPTFSYFLSLIPENFANLTDFLGMLVLLQDFRATNLQEAANLWRTEQYHNSVAKQQQKQAQQLQQSNQQIAQLRQQAERLRKGQEAAQDAVARATHQLARSNEKLANLERYGAVPMQLFDKHI